MSTFDEQVPVNFARAMPNWQPLVEYRRNGIAENTVHGAVSWVSGRNLIYSFGGNVEVYGRSMVKPVMMKVFAREFRDVHVARSYVRPGRSDADLGLLEVGILKSDGSQHRA